MKHILKTLLLLTLAVNTATAHEENIPAGATVINLQESASKKVEEDRISATLQIQKVGVSAKAIQNDINKAMQNAVDIAKKSKNVEIETGGYNVYLEQKNKHNMLEQDRWNGSQQLILDSKNKEEILELVTKITAQGFVLNGLNYYLSNEKVAEQRDELMEKAIANIKTRAEKVAAQLSMPNIQIAEINLTNNYYRPMQKSAVMRTMAFGAADSMAEAVVEGSKQDVEITVSAKVYLTK